MSDMWWKEFEITDFDIHVDFKSGDVADCNISCKTKKNGEIYNERAMSYMAEDGELFVEGYEFDGRECVLRKNAIGGCSILVRV
ncbi:MAG: hypothetical protein DRN81_05800 [Thermoproteota archaeon]|nr:MAG: hypothetical protein DRN81_05800 [Candidatus Korarchaeota archaeon]